MDLRHPEQLLYAARDGDRAATGRLLSLVERGGQPARQLSRLTMRSAVADVAIIGVTGAPGVGKSTLVARLIARARSEAQRVAVLAVDASSPRSGGAFLGDRIRMQNRGADPGVFIRSMANRGNLDGLTVTAHLAIRVLMSVGVEAILIETVGVGQGDPQIRRAVDTTVVVLSPGWGDAVQFDKAGLLEAADVLVVNKADGPGATKTSRDLTTMLEVGASTSTKTGAWRPPIVMTCATEGQGIKELWDELAAHRTHLDHNGLLAARRDDQLLDELDHVLVDRLITRVASAMGSKAWAKACSEVVSRRLDPYTAADRLLQDQAWGCR